MSVAVLPALPGLSFPEGRSFKFNTTIQESVSGAETAIARWTYPRWTWTLTWGLLRNFAALPEYQTFIGFGLSRMGRFDTWLYQDADDNQVVDQMVGIGDGVTTTFQLVRSWGGLGGFVEPIFAPHLVSAIRVNGTALAAATWSAAPWGSTAPGQLTLASPPAVGAAVKGDFSYYFPVRFAEDNVDFEKFMLGRFRTKEIKFSSIKLGA